MSAVLCRRISGRLYCLSHPLHDLFIRPLSTSRVWCQHQAKLRENADENNTLIPPTVSRLRAQHVNFPAAAADRIIDAGILAPAVNVPPASVVRSSTTTPTAADLPAATSKQPRRDPLDLTFSNPKSVYKSKTTWELFRGIFVLSMCRNDWLVEHSMQIMKWARRSLGQSLFQRLMKMTIYGHFVAGENQETIKPTLDRMLDHGVKSILDYGAEQDLDEAQAVKAEMQSCASSATDDAVNAGVKNGTVETPDILQRFEPQAEFGDRRKQVYSARTFFYESEAMCERNLEIFLRCIDAVSDSTRGTGFAAIKLTALGRPQVLMQLSSALILTRLFLQRTLGRDRPVAGDIISEGVPYAQFERKLRDAGVKLDNEQVDVWMKHIDYDAAGVIDLVQWRELFEQDFKLREIFRLPVTDGSGQFKRLIRVTPEEEERFRNMIRRLCMIADYALEKDVRVMIDAEQSYFQPAISRLALELMRRYNTEKAIIFNTYQCYLQDAHDQISAHLQLSRREDFYFGCKVVRGAYMVQERERAHSLGYDDPILPNFAATTDMIQQVITTALNEVHTRGIDKKKVAVMVASHNEETVRFVVNKMQELGIEPLDRVVCFGQLLGMCDQVSFTLGQAGYSVYKYVPYGPVEEVLPYLMRRAHENRDVVKKSGKELKMLRAEFIRRIANGQWNLKPEGGYWSWN